MLSEVGWIWIDLTLIVLLSSIWVFGFLVYKHGTVSNIGKSKIRVGYSNIEGGLDRV